MPAFHIQRSILIKASAEKVFDTVSDFSIWSRWSPWLRIDKDAKVTVSDDPRSVGSQYSWTGELVGQGEIEHLKLDRPNSIDDEIRFLKPFKSKSNSVYHPCDLKLRRFDFTSGYAVQPSGQPPAGLTHCHLPPGKALHIRHTGSYANLGNAWSGAYQYARYKKIKIKRQDAFEIYRNDPRSTPPAEWVTDIYLHVK